MTETNSTEIALIPNVNEPTEKEQNFRAQFLHERIQANFIGLVFDLKEMRDKKLYSRLGFDNFKDYLKSTLPKFVTLSFASNLMLLSDKMSEEDYKKTNPNQVQILAKIASNPDVFEISHKVKGEIHLSNGMVMDLEEYETTYADEIAQQTDVYREAIKVNEEHASLKKENARLERDLEVNEGVIAKHSDKIKSLTEAVDYLANEKGTTSDLIATVTTKVGASKRVMELLLSIEQAVVEINAIDDSIKADPDIAGSVLQLETMFKLAGTKLNNVWTPFFFAIQDNE
ncbi:hypothetical protein LEP1GSC034_1031 [Leptospira interrogans str. 2003000735]|uniref:Uncharacterized protein n=2 Tax=Leptospira interrogans TaxID=173 RepID=A0A829D3J3_LEPIR|nr:hypothetical protein [Leptospira interrogans]EMY06284.1 hypothetical protein LEP1GSC029_3168 [Leptospira interrogans str. 2002000626]EMY25607.1 hypothetical protein LEP1GSC115_1464 [Leptospira interrogans serovar Australis str. 200703203]EKN89856.1 hypothetical protein LEP1GSC027_3982 [Leptospira interrogans str. 2002000624]EKQ40254.1 hypothetical protein LEP1GSC025_2177 [Leptospira interrogans str. 2002000621]EKQ46055.1 hypothetical protein LEP1GSC026_3175 [Leptospira interrogans str. 2002